MKIRMPALQHVKAGTTVVCHQASHRDGTAAIAQDATKHMESFVVICKVR